jgi:predicted PurR-regulated permease PerM
VAARRKTSPMSHPVVVTFLILAIVAFMSLAAEVLKPLALAVLLSFALAPLARFLERRRVPRVAAVVLTGVVALGALGGAVLVVGRQLTALADRLPDYETNILRKVKRLTPTGESAFAKASLVVSDVAKSLDQPLVKRDDVKDVRVVAQPTFQERLRGAVGPSLGFLGMGSLVLVLVLFLLLNREDLSDRSVQLFGQRQVGLTTRTMEEVGQRISRYLAMFVTVNSCYGLVAGLGLWAIGVPYALLWGFMAAGLRFIPYIGPAVAFVLPLLFSIAYFRGWGQALGVLALFGVIEALLNSFLEPIIYGKTTGVSTLSLLVAAMFWTWLWGTLGLLLSTPLTVCLAVLGKHIPSLGFFAVLLGEEVVLDPDVRFYQRLVSLDSDGATEIIEATLEQRSRAELFDEVLVPALTRAERDSARDELDDRDRAFIWRVIAEVLNELEGRSDQVSPPAALASPAGADQPPLSAKVLGIAANDTPDALVLRMLAQLLNPSGCAMEIVTGTESPSTLTEVVVGHAPDLVVISHLPPVGLPSARYLVRRLRARFERLPILVGRWGGSGDTAGATLGLTAEGASHVVFQLADARERIVSALQPQVERPTLAVPTPA